MIRLPAIEATGEPLLRLPQSDGFEATIVKIMAMNTAELDSVDKVVPTNSVRGRARTYQYRNGPHGETGPSRSTGCVQRVLITTGSDL